MTEKLYDACHQEIELTAQQQACLKYAGDRTLMVKGYAGAGKSLVLMAIARKYLEKYGAEKNKVAIFTFQNTLVSTTREFLQVNGGNEEGIVISTVNSYLTMIYEELVRQGKAPRRSYPNPSGKEDGALYQRLKTVEAALNRHRARYGKHRFQDLPYEFWLEEFDWMKDMNIGREDLDAYLLYGRKGRGNRYRFSKADYTSAFQIYCLYLTCQEEAGQGDWADQPMFLIRHADQIEDRYRFDHILIDEAQDLSLAQMMALMLLYKKGGDMVVAMDANQKIHGKQWTPKLLGIEAATKKLTKSMRTTLQIDRLAESVRSRNDKRLDEDDQTIRVLPERTGPLPKLVHLRDSAAEQKYVVELTKAYLKANPHMTIGILAAKNRQIDLYSSWLTSAGIDHEQIRRDTTFSMSKSGVKVASAYSAKGLEFNAVIIPMFIEGCFPYPFQTDDEEEYELYLMKMRNLVYVSMTRAKNLLVITWWGEEGSRFLADMDPALYEAEGEPFEKPLERKSFSPVPRAVEQTQSPAADPLVSRKPRGFVDYQGTKEDRYSDVLAFIKTRREEEVRRQENAEAERWVAATLKDARYCGLSPNDLLKYIMVRYQNLCGQKDEILAGRDKGQLEVQRLWSDFGIFLIAGRLESLRLPREKCEAYCQTFLEKVFRESGFTPPAKHYESLAARDSYRRYFANCFDLFGEKQFWRWLGSLGQGDRAMERRFLDLYEQLSVLLGYYLFRIVRPDGAQWRKRLELEGQALEKLREDYRQGRFREPDRGKLQNPLYQPHGSRLDWERFAPLLEEKKLPAYVEACRMLRRCGLPPQMDALFGKLIARLPVLWEALGQFAEVYQPDMDSFYEYYIPEALSLASNYVEYLDAGIDGKIVEETEKEVLDAAKKLEIAVNDKIDEIYSFASMEIKARAKALESVMSQDGYVDPEFKINKK